MRTIKSVIEETKSSLELRGLIEVYEEVAAIRMQKIRQAILKAREFYEGLSQLSEDVGSDFSQISSLGERSAAVLLSANSGLYGDIIDKTFNTFLDFTAKNRADVFVVGRLGEKMIKTRAPRLKYQLFLLSDDKIELSLFSELAKRVLPYKKVFVFYGRFKNIAVQMPAEMRLSGDLLPEPPTPQRLREAELEYLYEPSLVEVSRIFAQEILSSVLEQTVRESQLAKFASRMMHLDRSMEKIDASLGKLGIERRSLEKQRMLKKQNLMVASVIASGARW